MMMKMNTFLGCRLRSWSIYMTLLHAIFYGLLLCFLVGAQFICIPRADKGNDTDSLGQTTLAWYQDLNDTCNYRVPHASSWKYDNLIMYMSVCVAFLVLDLAVVWATVKKCLSVLLLCIILKIVVIAAVISAQYEMSTSFVDISLTPCLPIVVDCFIIYFLIRHYNEILYEKYTFILYLDSDTDSDDDTTLWKSPLLKD